MAPPIEQVPNIKHPQSGAFSAMYPNSVTHLALLGDGGKKTDIGVMKSRFYVNFLFDSVLMKLHN